MAALDDTADGLQWQKRPRPVVRLLKSYCFLIIGNKCRRNLCGSPGCPAAAGGWRMTSRWIKAGIAGGWFVDELRRCGHWSASYARLVPRMIQPRRT